MLSHSSIWGVNKVAQKKFQAVQEESDDEEEFPSSDEGIEEDSDESPKKKAAPAKVIGNFIEIFKENFVIYF